MKRRANIQIRTLPIPCCKPQCCTDSQHLLTALGARNETGSKTRCGPSLLELGQVGSTLYLTVLCVSIRPAQKEIWSPALTPPPHPPLPGEVISLPLNFFSSIRSVTVSPSEHIWLMFMLRSFSGWGQSYSLVLGQKLAMARKPERPRAWVQPCEQSINLLCLHNELSFKNLGCPSSESFLGGQSSVCIVVTCKD